MKKEGTRVTARMVVVAALLGIVVLGFKAFICVIFVLVVTIAVVRAVKNDREEDRKRQRETEEYYRQAREMKREEDRQREEAKVYEGEEAERLRDRWDNSGIKRSTASYMKWLEKTTNEERQEYIAIRSVLRPDDPLGEAYDKAVAELTRRLSMIEDCRSILLSLNAEDSSEEIIKQFSPKMTESMDKVRQAINDVNRISHGQKMEHMRPMPESRVKGYAANNHLSGPMLLLLGCLLFFLIVNGLLIGGAALVAPDTVF